MAEVLITRNSFNIQCPTFKERIKAFGWGTSLESCKASSIPKKANILLYSDLETIPMASIEYYFIDDGSSLISKVPTNHNVGLKLVFI